MRFWLVAVLWLAAGTAAAKPNPDKGETAPDDPPQEISSDDPVPAPVPVPPKPEPKPKPVTPTPGAKHVTTMDDLTVPKSFLRFGINFFGDASVFATTPDEPHTGFAIGTLAVRMLGELGPTLDALAELGFETTATGPIADVEQVAIRWRRGPGVLQLGRFHTDIGYWNTAYHHGLWLQTPVARPHVVRFEDDGGLLPVHWVGAEYALSTKLGGGKATVIFGVGNGRGSIVDDVLVARDNNDRKAVHLKARFKSTHLEMGAGVIYDLIAPQPVAVRPAAPDQNIFEIIGSAHVVVRGNGPIVIAEAHVVQHRFRSDRNTTFSGYGLFGFAVTEWLTPYAAIDVIDGADTDPFFVPDPANPIAIDVIEGLAGLRFETSTWSALKAELVFRSQRNDPDGDDDYTAVVSWSFGL